MALFGGYSNSGTTSSGGSVASTSYGKGLAATTGTKGNIYEGPSSNQLAPWQQGPVQNDPVQSYTPPPTPPSTLGLINSAPEVPSSSGTGSISIPSGPFVPEPSPSPAGTPGGGDVVNSTGGGSTPDFSSLLGSMGQATAQAESYMPQQSPAMTPLNLRQGLGNRMYPQESDALAALKKIY